jgi:hypothetical protein
MYLQKMNLSCQHVTKASTYITVHYRNSIHSLSCSMDSVQPRTSSVWMECILASHTRHAECSRMKHVATHKSQTDAKMGSVEWITPSTLAIPMMRYDTSIKHVAHLVWLCKKEVWHEVNVLEVSKISHRLNKPPERTQKIPLGPLGLVYP